MSKFAFFLVIWVALILLTVVQPTPKTHDHSYPIPADELNNIVDEFEMDYDGNDDPQDKEDVITQLRAMIKYISEGGKDPSVLKNYYQQSPERFRIRKPLRTTLQQIKAIIKAYRERSRGK